MGVDPGGRGRSGPPMEWRETDIDDPQKFSLFYVHIHAYAISVFDQLYSPSGRQINTTKRIQENKQ